MEMHWAYIAGYFDGEGTVGFHEAAHHRTRQLVWHNSHHESLRAMQSFMGMGQLAARPRRDYQKSAVYTLTICNKRHMLRAIDGMRPYLFVKLEAAERLYEYLVDYVDETRMANYGKMAEVPTEQLKAWYFDEGLSMYAIGKMVGVCTAAVSQSMRVRGLKGRPAGGSQMKGKPKSEDMKAKLRATKRKQWDDPAFRAKHIANLAKGAVVSREKWKDPEFRAAAIAARWGDLEV